MVLTVAMAGMLVVAVVVASMLHRTKCLQHSSLVVLIGRRVCIGSGGNAGAGADILLATAYPELLMYIVTDSRSGRPGEAGAAGVGGSVDCIGQANNTLHWT
jgi:hypothetical protein